jgi:hypothetical protein
LTAEAAGGVAGGSWSAMLYEHEDDVVRMLYICRHEDLYGKRAKQLATRIQELRGELKAKDQPKRPPG